MAPPKTELIGRECRNCRSTFLSFPSRNKKYCSVSCWKSFTPPTDHAICVMCKLDKPASEFGKTISKKNGLSSQCLECRRVADRKRGRSIRLARLGLNLEQYEHMLIAQDGKCAICNIVPVKRNGILVVDHNHVNGEIRKLLCVDCNLGLGHFMDSISNIKNAFEYLVKYGGSK